jgi:hypothetical protein
MTKEVQALRADHNLAPDTAILDVASALRRHVDVKNFDRVLDSLSEGAAKFWRPYSERPSGSPFCQLAREFLCQIIRKMTTPENKFTLA